MPTDEDDSALVQAARGGDKAAFATLLTRHRPLLVALCRRALGDALLAEDAAQEAALQALLNLDRLRHAERFGPWLGGIGLNVCRRWLRERSRDSWSWEVVCGGRQALEPVDWRADPADLAEAADLAERVRRAVAELPRGQRAAVLLFYLSGLTYAETAALLGVEVGAVKTRLHKARRTLRKRLWTIWREDDMTAATDSQMVDMRVADVRRAPATDDKPERYLVILEEVGGARRLPIWIGSFEGEVLALALVGVQAPRPLAYALAAELLRAAGGRLREVRISKVQDGVIYAVVVVEGSGGGGDIDARPSDALNLALVAGAPIRAEPAVLDAEAAMQASAPERTRGVQSAFYGAGAAGAADIAAEIAARFATR